MEVIKQQMTGSENSPILARAPLLLSESMLFPYREGLSFEQDVWMDRGQAAAFTGTLDHPPTSSWEIMNPLEYEKGHAPAVPLLPNIHPLVDSLYKPYDIGQIGQLDLHILTELFGGDEAAADLTPAWDGGLYWAGQRLSAKTRGRASPEPTPLPSSIFLSGRTRLPRSAFAQLYAEELGHKYSGVELISPDAAPVHSSHSSGYKVFPPAAAKPDESEDAANSAHPPLRESRRQSLGPGADLLHQ